MKVLKDPNQVLHIMDAKLDELYERFDKANGEEAAEISGKDVAIINIAGHIRYAIKDHGCFEESDMAGVYEYADGAKEEANKYYRNPLVTWFAKGLAKGAEWACVGLEARMEE